MEDSRSFNELNYSQFLKDNQFVWLVTGAAGFIGSNLVERLLVNNQLIIGIDNFETGYEENLIRASLDARKLNPSIKIDKATSLAENFLFFRGDIRNIDEVKMVFSKDFFKKRFKKNTQVDYVLHQAALGSVPRSISDPLATNSTNISGFLNVLLCAKDFNVRKFIYAASSSTYGDSKKLPKIEEVIGRPLSPYAVTKLANELYADVFSRTYGIDLIGLRYFNIFGKRQDPNGTYAAVIPRWINAILSNETVYINGDGSTSRDFCYIENAVNANILAALSNTSKLTDKILNIAHGHQTSLNDLYQIINKQISKKIPYKIESKLIYRDFRVGDVQHSLANISKAKKHIGYSPVKDVLQGMAETVDWYLNESL